MVEFQQMLDQVSALAGAESWAITGSDAWMTAPGLDPVELARLLLAAGARLVTLSGVAAGENETWVIYHYAWAGNTLSVRVLSRDGALQSITPLTPAAGWIEREIQDLFALTFTGHPQPERLVRPPQLDQGFFRRPGGASSRGY